MYGFTRQANSEEVSQLTEAPVDPSPFYVSAYDSPYVAVHATLRTPVPYERPRRSTTARPNAEADWASTEIGHLLESWSALPNDAIQASPMASPPKPPEPHRPSLATMFQHFLVMASFGHQEAFRARAEHRQDVHSNFPPASPNYYRGQERAAATPLVPLRPLAAVDEHGVGASINSVAG